MFDLKRILSALILLAAPAISHAAVEYRLDAALDPLTGTVTGTAVIESTEPVELNLYVGGMQADAAVDAERPDENTLRVRVAPESPATVTYRMQAGVDGMRRGLFMSDEHVFFHGAWYPVPDVRASYETSVTLPEDFVAVSEAEAIERTESDDAVTTRFTWPHPVERVSLVASRLFRTDSATTPSGVAVEAYFFDDDARYMDDYIEKTVEYIELYESMLGAFPYRRFAVVENVIPTGWSLPTYTLLGQQVVRLPFILDTSLGHEVLHQYFGGLVDVERESGNWVEGLTTYLADRLYAERNGEGPAYRHRTLTNYQARVHAGAERPVVSFINPGHAAGRALGYGKVSMVFHMLKNEIGEDAFMQGLQRLIDEHRDAAASWDDIRTVMEAESDRDLGWFFDQWLRRAGGPVFDEPSADIDVVNGRFRVRLTVRQLQAGDPYRMSLPVTVMGRDESFRSVITVSEKQTTRELFVDFEPRMAAIDDEFDVFRRLSPEEFPPVVSRMLGAEHVMMVLPDEASRRTYAPFIDLFSESDHHVVLPDEVGFDNLSTHTMVIFGAKNPVLEKVFAETFHEARGVSVDIRENPFGDDAFVVGVIDAKDAEEAAPAARKLPHYGSYSMLAFRKGENIEKVRGEPAVSGVMSTIRMPSRAVPVAQVSPLAEIVRRSLDRNVIFVGEKHDAYAHHVNQLAVIKEVAKTGRPMAIGMEMFQRPMQEYLDAYIAGDISESEMLAKTEYFDRWRFDWNLYAMILRFAKENGIPVVALNVDKDITRQVAEGGFDSLNDEQKAKLPDTMNFTNRPYREHLRRIFSFHTGRDNFDYFLQSQVLWDEVMADSIHEYLKDRPDTIMVVLAGNGHLRYMTSIPDRAVRRGGYNVSVILQDMDPLPGIADWVLTTEPLDGVDSPKLGVMLRQTDDGLLVTGVAEGSNAARAGVEKEDVIVSFDGVAVQTIGELKSELARFGYGESAPFMLERDGLRSEFTVTFTEKEEQKAPHGAMGGVNPHK